MAVIILICLIMFFLLFLQIISLRLIYLDEFIIDIDFLFIRVILYPERNRKTRRIANVGLIEKTKRKLLKYNMIVNVLRYGIAYSRITINEINLIENTNKNTERPSKAVLNAQSKKNLIYVILAYFLQETDIGAKPLPRISFFTANNTELISTLDVTFKLTLYNFLRVFAKYRMENIKRKRGFKIVRD